MERPREEVVERHITPDGLLSFVVLRYEGETALGFECGPSHTHGDILPGALRGLPQDDAIRQYVDDLIQNRSWIAVERSGGKIVDAWVVDEYDISRMRPLPDRPVELRCWDGTAREAPTTQRSATNSESE